MVRLEKLIKKSIIFLLFFMCIFISSIEAKGKSLRYEQIKCKDGKHSYVVYLPPNYDESKTWPVLFCFDPSAIGDYAAKVFSSAATDYGWIVAGSLDAKNGPWEPIKKAQKAMLEDIVQRYKVDTKQLYAAGFSGGARMEYTMAYKDPGMFKGVIACGAGFGEGEISKRVSVFHCIGKKDNNYDEIKKVHNILISKGISSKLRVFEGGHDWPPDEVIIEALEWISKN